MLKDKIKRYYNGIEVEFTKDELRRMKEIKEAPGWIGNRRGYEIKLAKKKKGNWQDIAVRKIMQELFEERDPENRILRDWCNGR